VSTTESGGLGSSQQGAEELRSRHGESSVPRLRSRKFAAPVAKRPQTLKRGRARYRSSQSSVGCPASEENFQITGVR
jgi:hypothetical protein